MAEGGENLPFTDFIANQNSPSFRWAPFLKILSGPDRRFAVTGRRSGDAASLLYRDLGLFPEEGGRVSGF